MTDFSIGQLASRAGVEASTVRYYERIGLLPPPRRTNGRRLYGEESFKQLALIRATKEVGFTIAEIQTLISAWESQGRSPREWPRFVRSKIAEMDATIARARAMKRVLSSVLACKCWDDLAIPFSAFVAAFTAPDLPHGIEKQPGRRGAHRARAQGLIPR